MKFLLPLLLLCCTFSMFACDETEQKSVGDPYTTSPGTSTILEENTPVELPTGLIVQNKQEVQVEVIQPYKINEKKPVVIKLPADVKLKLLEPATTEVPKGTSVLSTSYNWVPWIVWSLGVGAMGYALYRSRLTRKEAKAEAKNTSG